MPRMLLLRLPLGVAGPRRRPTSACTSPDIPRAWRAGESTRRTSKSSPPRPSGRSWRRSMPIIPRRTRRRGPLAVAGKCSVLRPWRSYRPGCSGRWRTIIPTSRPRMRSARSCRIWTGPFWRADRACSARRLGRTCARTRWPGGRSPTRRGEARQEMVGSKPSRPWSRPWRGWPNTIAPMPGRGRPGRRSLGLMVSHQRRRRRRRRQRRQQMVQSSNQSQAKMKYGHLSPLPITMKTS
mmetsp:Transcript_8052/g.22514  ORF Transcript_8052/g.22514 Transcript_8052/m.22514 type:complete len:238 (+) Transcript_8052:312-1025(+)